MSEVTEDPFADPASGFERMCDEDLVGELMLVTPLEYFPNIKTSNGETAAINVDCAILTGEQAGYVLEDTRVFAKRLVPMFKKRIGKEQAMVLGRLGQTDNEKDKSKNAKKVWTFEAPNDADKAIAREYLAKKPAPADPFASDS